MEPSDVYISGILAEEEAIQWPLQPGEPTNTFGWIQQRSSAQKALHARSETEAIERALDFSIAEHEKNRLVLQATERFIKNGIETKDVYGSLVG